MADTRTIVSWIGHADLLAMADDLGDAGRELLAGLKISGRAIEKPGPLKTAVQHGKFDEIHLLSNYPDAVHAPFIAWLGAEASIHPVEVTDPIDHSQVFQAADRVLGTVTRRRGRKPRTSHPAHPRQASDGRGVGAVGQEPLPRHLPPDLQGGTATGDHPVRPCGRLRPRIDP